jgi:hypothetical protein
MPTLKNSKWSLAELFENAVVRSCLNADLRACLRLWAADCGAYALKDYERHYCCPCPRQAVIAGRMHARGEIDAQTMNSFLRAASDIRRQEKWDKDAVAAIALAEACSVPTLEGMIEKIRYNAPVGSKMEKWQKARLIKRLKNKDLEDYPLPKKTRVLSEPSYAMPF